MRQGKDFQESKWQYSRVLREEESLSLTDHSALPSVIADHKVQAPAQKQRII